MTHQSLYALLEGKYGIPILYGRRSVEAILADTDAAESLGLEVGAPILLLRSTSYSEDGRPVEHFVAQHRGDLSRFEVNLVRGHQASRSVSSGGAMVMLARSERELGCFV
jgi:GntR family transcriptional regulator